MWRTLRHWITARGTDAALLAAPRLSEKTLGRIGRLLGRLGRAMPILARQVADNMRAAGVYSAAEQRAYFDQLGMHFTGALLALRCSGRKSSPDAAALADVADRYVELDRSVADLAAATAPGRGIILIGPHIAGYLLNLARLNRELPLTVYLRHSKDAPRREAKQRWYIASGVDWISESANAGGSLGRMGRMADALAAGRVLFITPDLPQKRDEGTPVRLFGRWAYLPPGPAWLALRTGAPVYLLTARRAGDRQRLEVQGPFDGASAVRDRGERRAAVAECMQWFAAGLERFLREQPPLWYLWGDKRWTRVFRGDAKYAAPLHERIAPPTGATARAVGAL